jgi:colanic acid biosynthesis glycosyl transferase WcaI
MAMGLPLLVAAPTGEATSIAEADGAGLCVPAGDPSALAMAAARLKDDVELRANLAKRALAAAPGHSRETQARDMLAAIEAAIGNRPHVRTAKQPKL